MQLLAEEKVTKCPVCHMPQQAGHRLNREGKEPLVWYHCYCDTVFHDEKIDKGVFNVEYYEEYRNKKYVDVNFEYLLRTYVPLIEEITYGRKFLDVGFTLPHRIQEMNKRGWFATGIDLIDNLYCTGNFEHYAFDDKFDFILMGHVLQSFDNPVNAIFKAHKLLNQSGVLMITTPAPELIRSIGTKHFGHWDSKGSWIYVSMNQMKRIACKMGFKVCYAEHNISKRFGVWNDLHIIMVKE